MASRAEEQLSGGPIAVVVLSWNRREDTLACLESLAEVEAPGLITILVDNASTDGTSRRCEPRSRTSSSSHEKNLGFAEGNNVGIRRALELGAG